MYSKVAMLDAIWWLAAATTPCLEMNSAIMVKAVTSTINDNAAGIPIRKNPWMVFQWGASKAFHILNAW